MSHHVSRECRDAQRPATARHDICWLLSADLAASADGQCALTMFVSVYLSLRSSTAESWLRQRAGACQLSSCPPAEETLASSTPREESDLKPRRLLGRSAKALFSSRNRPSLITNVMSKRRPISQYYFVFLTPSEPESRAAGCLTRHVELLVGLFPGPALLSRAARGNQHADKLHLLNQKAKSKGKL